MLQHAIEVDHNGLTLRGSVYRPDGHKRVPTVLMLHGFTGQRIEAGFMFVHLARALARRGMAAVTFDFINSGESDGSFDQMLVTQELADTLRMIEWASGQPFADRSRMGLLGFSLGGLLAACASAQMPQCRSLMLLAPTTVNNLSRHAQDRKPDPVTGQYTMGALALNANFFDDMQQLDPLSDVVKHSRPTLLVQGSGDTAVPPEVSQKFVDAMKQANVPVTHQLIRDAEHTFAKPQWREQLYQTVTDFATSTLLS